MTFLRRNRLFTICAVLTVCSITAAPTAFGAHSDTADEGERLPGVSLAEGVSQMTGVAISPLLGVSAVGAWKYFRTDASKRHLLPWFCKPVFWGSGLVILGLCFLKDSIGTGAPPLIKKPLDLVELFESKASAAVASTAFVPFVAKQMAENYSGGSASAVGGEIGNGLFAAIPVAFSMHFLLVPICVFGFLMVWIVSHAINVLILISPFGLIDAFLKSCRLVLLSSIAVLYAISPVLAAFVALVVIVIAAILAPTAFRLTVFGTVMSVDWVLSIFRKSKDSENEKVYGFLAKRGSQKLKTRCFGTLERNAADGRLVFNSKLCFFGPTRKLVLPDTANLSMTRGLLFPSVSMVDSESGKNKLIVNLLPRFRGDRTEHAGELLGITQILDSSMSRGIKAMWEWFRDILISSRDKIADAAGNAKERILPPSLPPSSSH